MPYTTLELEAYLDGQLSPELMAQALRDDAQPQPSEEGMKSMADQQIRSPRASRGWSPRWTLRSLFVAVTVAAVLIGIKVNRVQREQAAVAKLTALGVYIHYDHAHTALPANQLAWQGTWVERIAFPRLQKTQPRAPQWLRHCVGDDYVQSVTAVTLLTNDQSGIRQALPHLRQLPHLKEILLSSPTCGNALPTFRNAKQLIERELPDVKITEIGGIPIVG